MQTESDFVNASNVPAGPTPELRVLPGLRESLSAMLDGEASVQEADAVLSALSSSAAERQAWNDYLWLGQTLRTREQVMPPANAAFVAGVMERIRDQAVAGQRSAPEALGTPVALPMAQAANDAVFRWKMVAGVATLAAAAALVWQVAVVPHTGAQLAQAPQVPAVEQVAANDGTQAVQTDHGIVIRDPQLEALLAEHRQHGGMSALQMPAGFLRNATYEAPQR